MRAADTSFLDRIVEPISRCLTPESAREIVDLRADPELQARLDELAGKCNEGSLTPSERAQYLLYVEAIDLIAILQSKARILLRKKHRTNGRKRA